MMVDDRRRSSAIICEQLCDRVRSSAIAGIDRAIGCNRLRSSTIICEQSSAIMRLECVPWCNVFPACSTTSGMIPWQPVVCQLLHVREQFMEEIGKYDCLFNRYSKEFKDKFKKINAWSKEGEVFSISLAGAKKKFRNLRTTYERYLTRRNIVFRLLTAPVQFSPSPIYPGLHVQTYDMCVLVHAAFAWHSIEVVLHSSKSVKNK